ncbi:NADP-dependent oxidoreductase [Alteromonas macleodii]|jgi:NADPH-dependent curcumin reductase CurA|uniref:NADP-dependent oxidoreductase n=1 Tax=unclassified Alteromonas TaxID=2614992 RepID=UPI001EF17D05|nr:MULTISPECIES: NADP-dependent oxidoreductase [unclassified Alteromonas]MCG7635879.1 NADP-dependent oxidoreductase [Alteromonas sp. CNT1-28]MCG7811244.1 NADP-dependent oxidoreductase [Alteromonas sp. MCA-1]|tara:strand:+ start:419 stop:1417 length:999 start_codon:yes stop_codon:yes gene_type:complete
MSTYKAITLVNRPHDRKIGPHLFESKELEIPTPKDGQILIKQTHMSLDPAMLGWMSEDRESYIPPVELGDVMRSSGVGEVVESNNPNFSVGDKVMGMTGWSEYVLSDGSGFNKLQPGITEEMALCVFALPGLTATTGLYNFGQPKEGETLIVTGAAGSVGSIVGQLAKADGLRVIGVVGSEDKADWIVNELGFDGAINYKTDNLEEKLAELTPNKIDVFFENTGGPIQQHIFNRMNAHGRIVVCGMIADYQSEKPSPGPNWIPLIKKRINIRGFAMPDHWGEIPQLLQKLSLYVQQGKIKYRAHTVEGLENAEKGLNMLFEGKNTGKMIVKL